MRSYRVILALSLVLGVVQIAVAQSPDTLWMKTFGTPDGDFGNAVVTTTDGGYAIAGQIGTTFASVDSGDVWLVRTDAAGDTLWTKRYGGTGRDNGAALQQTSDNGFIIAGYTQPLGGIYRDMLLIRIDAAGDTLWTRTYGGGNSETAESVQQTSDGGFIVAGTTRSYGAGSSDIWLVRTDANGDTMWTQTYGSIYAEAGRAVQQTADNGYIITGRTLSPVSGAYDLWLVRTDAAGDTLWTRAYNGPYYFYSSDDGNAVRQTADGGFVIIGETTGASGTTNSDAWLLRTDAAGDTLWTGVFGSSSTDRGYDVQETADGGFIFVGFSLNFPSDINAMVFRTNANGDSLWSMMLGDAGNDQFTSIAKTSDGGYVVCGFTSSYSVGDNDAWMLRLASENPNAVGDPLSAHLPRQVALARNYPNPFNPATTIRFSLREAGRVTLEIFDISGRRIVGAYRHTPLSAGWHEFMWDGRNDAGKPVASGFYLYRLTAGDVVQTRKMLLVR